MSLIDVDTEARRIRIGKDWADCVIGRGGACPAVEKREGDGRTPLGDWRILGALLRPDRGFAPPAMLPWRWLRPNDGWSDDVRDPVYNRPVCHPHPFSAEQLWRKDGLYDAIVWLDYNDSPPLSGAGSAIFLHLRESNVTEGCVAVSREAMASLLTTLTLSDLLSIR